MAADMHGRGAQKGMQAVLFDNDGTIADTKAMIVESFQYATQTVLHKSFPEETFMAKSGIPLADMMADYTDDPTLQQELLDVYRTYNHKIHDERIALFAGEVEALEALTARGFRLGVVTSKLHALAQHGLDVLGISRFMDVLVGADDCEKAKPDSAPILIACAALGVEPARTVYVGDSPFDIQAGNAAGCHTIAVSWGHHPVFKLQAQHPDVLIDGFSQLAGAVEALTCENAAL